jgi:hypothetical protein
MMRFRRQGILAGISQAVCLRDRCLALVVLLAFFFQGLAVQTHIHSPAGTAGIAAAISSKSSLPSLQTAPNPLPSKDNQADCPLCQAGVLSGTFITPAAINFLPVISFFRPKSAASEILAPSLQLSHNWQGRAPPRI